MNRRVFLKLSGLSAVGALASKLGLSVLQALAHGGVVEFPPEPLGEELVYATPDTPSAPSYTHNFNVRINNNADPKAMEDAWEKFLGRHSRLA